MPAGIKDGIRSSLAALPDGIGSSIAAVSDGFGNSLTAVSDGVGNSIAAVSDGVGTRIAHVSEGVGIKIAHASEEVGNKIVHVSEGVGSTLAHVSDEVGNKIAHVSDEVGNTIAQVSDGMGNTLAAVSDGVGTAIAVPVHQVQRLEKKLRRKVLRATLEGDLGLCFEENDEENPRNWQTWMRVLYSIGPILTAFVVSLSNPLYNFSIPGIIEKFQISQELAFAGISLYALGLALGPIFSTSISEVIGRRFILAVSLILCLIFTIVAGSASHVRTILVARLLASVCGSPCVTVPVGILNDMWNLEEDVLGSLSVVLLIVSTVWAMSLGQTIGASIVHDTKDWRWTFWMSAIFLSISLIAVLPIPETYEPEILRKRAARQGVHVPRRQIKSILLISIGRPLDMLAVEPIIWPTSLFAGLAQATVYCFYVAYPVAFRRFYHFNDYAVGMAFLPLFIGNVIAVPILGYFRKVKNQRQGERAIENGRIPLGPEARLYPSMFGSVLMPLSLFWLAWTARPSIHWIVPLLAGIPFGISYVLLVLSLPLYKNDVYGTHFGASSLAVDTFARYGASASIPLFTTQMIDGIGFDWTISLLAFLTILLLPVPWVIFKWGPALRAKSTYVRLAKETDRAEDKAKDAIQALEQVLAFESDQVCFGLPEISISADLFHGTMLWPEFERIPNSREQGPCRCNSQNS